MEKMNDLKDLLKHEVEDLKSAEQQIIDALPKMIEKANNPTLKEALQEHLELTQTHKSRCEEVLEMLTENEEEKQQPGVLAKLFGGGETVCKGMQGLIKEGEKIINADMNPQVVDAAIISCAQKIEHYEICGYGTVRAYANELNLPEVSRILEETLNDEYDADDLLTTLAYGGLNREAEDGRSTKNENASSAMMEDGATAGKNSKTSRSSSNGNGKAEDSSGSRRRRTQTRTKEKSSR